ncbi:hypothetical protein L1887_14640 [Cichorium endivia]|nr:hypothetical protein L1887_14640 [Cichorium endivia]
MNPKRYGGYGIEPLPPLDVDPCAASRTEIITKATDLTTDDEDDNDAEEEDEEEEDDDDVQEEDMGTEYLVRPVANPEHEKDASDFEPEENGVDEDEFEEEDDEDDEQGGGGENAVEDSSKGGEEEKVVVVCVDIDPTRGSDRGGGRW